MICDKPNLINNVPKGKVVSWTFTLKTSKLLQNVGLLNHESHQYFTLNHVKHRGISAKEDLQEIIKTFSTPSENCREWTHPNATMFQKNRSTVDYRVKVTFQTDVFGDFREDVVFNFGQEPHLKQVLTVKVSPSRTGDGGDGEEEDEEFKRFQDQLLVQKVRWDSTNTTIIDFDPPMLTPNEDDKTIVESYFHPQPEKFQINQSTFDKHLSRVNYRSRMHDLLYIEEMSQFDHLSEHNVKCNLRLTENYLLASSAASSAKYARPGELFGRMALGTNLSEDTPAGRLILTNCSMLLLEVVTKTKANAPKGKRKAYVAAIEDSGKSELYLRLSSKLVEDYNLKDQKELRVEVQFQLNRIPLCEMHYAVDKLPDLELVYPDIKSKPVIPWTPGKQWSLEGMDNKLNTKQREAIVAITAPRSILLPPILLIGPYGTGKTFTMGQAIKILLKKQSAKVLVCTHSNSAADLYISEYLHPFIEENPSLKLVRVYYKHRWVKTVNATVQKYCLITQTENDRFFRNPTASDIVTANVVVATLSTSRFLSSLVLPPGYFTHIFIDEAAQAMECEALMPFTLSSRNTRVVLAGDHMQLSPEIFSPFALERKFNKSLLERLYDLYSADFPCKVMLCENYRSHEAIIDFTSELFYDQKLIASGRQPAHPIWFPLTVFKTMGEDVQDTNSTSFYNTAEVYEVVDRVAELQKSWPASWGQRDENSIGVVTPYYDQVWND